LCPRSFGSSACSSRSPTLAPAAASLGATARARRYRQGHVRDPWSARSIMTSVGSFAVALARLGDPTIMARMPPTKLWSSADLDAVIERVAPDVPNLLALLLLRSSRQAGSPAGWVAFCPTFSRWARLLPGTLLLGRCSVNWDARLATNPGRKEPPNLGTRADPGCSRPPADFRRMILPSAPAALMVRSCQAAATGGPRRRSIRRRIAANRARGTATSASWKTT
jgi:hypothetical protein